MEIDRIYEEFETLELSLYEKADLARKTASKARTQGNVKKWDKYNAIARVYEMVQKKVGPLTGELLSHTSQKYQDQRPCPF